MHLLLCLAGEGIL